jgi:hypothetical protein
VPFTCIVEVHMAGPFAQSLILELEDNGVRDVFLPIKGRGVSPEESEDVPR